MANRLLSEELNRLFDAVCGTTTIPCADERHAARAVYAMLRAGQPVTAAGLAAAVGWDHSRTQEFLDRLPDVERDDDGAVDGFGGLTLRPTAHRIVIGGQVRYAWCAWDTLFLPVALGVEVEVASRCPQTGRPIALRVAPTGVLEREPNSLVVTFLQPDAVDATDLRGSFCGAVHFLADAIAATHWNAQASDRLVLDPDDAFELGRHMILERCGPC